LPLPSALKADVTSLPSTVMTGPMAVPLTFTSASPPVTSCGIDDITCTVRAAEAPDAPKAPLIRAADAARRQAFAFILIPPKIVPAKQPAGPDTTSAGRTGANLGEFSSPPFLYG